MHTEMDRWTKIRMEGILRAIRCREEDKSSTVFSGKQKVSAPVPLQPLAFEDSLPIDIPPICHLKKYLLG